MIQWGWVIVMTDFLTYNFNISKVDLALAVEKSRSDREHRNRPFHGLVYVLEGRYGYRFLTGETYTVEKGRLFYLPKGSSYDVRETDDSVCLAVNFDLEDSDVTFPFMQWGTAFSSRFEGAFKRLVREWERKDAGYVLKSKSILYDVLYHIQREHDPVYLSGAQRDRMSKAMDYIKEYYCKKDISMEELARESGLTASYFRSLFRKQFGKSPQQYVTELRMERAMELLRSNMLSVAQVAEQCGYNGQSYFCREFKKHVGIAPSRYRTETV